MTRTEHIQDMLIIADKINAIVADMKARKEIMLQDMYAKAA
ncbi:hypothetical protein ACN2W4_20970 [Serratia marcescens]